MDLPTPPHISVRRLEIGKEVLYEYLIIQGKERINFFLDRASHESLLLAQRQADLATESQKQAQVSLQVLGS
jgi:hypothetical protein